MILGFSGEHGSDRLVFGPDDLKGLLQLTQICDSLALWYNLWLCGTTAMGESITASGCSVPTCLTFERQRLRDLNTSMAHRGLGQQFLVTIP